MLRLRKEMVIVDSSPFINQIVINKYNERGIVKAIDKERILVSFNNEEKLFSTEIVFTNHFLSFEDDQLNTLIKEIFIEKKEAQVRKQEEAHKTAIDRHKKVNARYQALKEKDRILKALFGRDFIYPPFEAFKKQYRFIIEKEKDLYLSLYGISQSYIDKYY